MLTQMCLAARLENEREGAERYRILPYVGNLLSTRGFQGTAEYLQRLNPEFATRFLAEEFGKANFDDRFLLSCWGTLDTLLWPLLTDDVIRCFTGSDFTMEELMLGPRPITVYVQIPESELQSLSPLVRLLFGSWLLGSFGRQCWKALPLHPLRRSLDQAPHILIQDDLLLRARQNEDSIG